MNAMSLASQMTGLPMKKPTHRGRKPSGKPGASHLAALQAAHGAGNLAQAKTHALNYAKAVHQSMAGTAGSASGPDEPDVTGSLDEAEPASMMAIPPAKPVAPKASAAPNPRLVQLAQIAKGRKK